MEIIQTNDYALISRLNQEVQELHTNMYPDYFKPYDFESVHAFFKQIITDPKFMFFVALEDGQEVGYIWIEIRDYKENAFCKPYRSIFIHHLNVLSLHRNRGFGKRMMDKAYEVATINEITKIELDYWIDNEVAKEFYKKQGFLKYRQFVYKDL